MNTAHIYTGDLQLGDEIFNKCDVVEESEEPTKDTQQGKADVKKDLV
jgi:hypothetical protein